MLVLLELAGDGRFQQTPALAPASKTCFVRIDAALA